MRKTWSVERAGLDHDIVGLPVDASMLLPRRFAASHPLHLRASRSGRLSLRLPNDRRRHLPLGFGRILRFSWQARLRPNPLATSLRMRV